MRYFLLAILVGVVPFVGCSMVLRNGGVFKIILGYSIPVDLKMPMSINYVHNFQFQYTGVDNASQVSYVQQGARSVERQPRTVTRKQIYSVIESVLDNPYDPNEDSDYSEAWRAGHEGQDCFAIYPKCPHGQTVLDHVSYYM